MIAGSYKNGKPVIIAGIDGIDLKRDCIQGSILNGVSEPFLFNFTLNQPQGHKIHLTAKINFFKNITKPVLSHITFYFEDDYHQAVDFNREPINFTCQLFII